MKFCCIGDNNNNNNYYKIMLSSLRSNQLVKSIFYCSKHFIASNNVDGNMIHEMVKQDCQLIERGAKIDELYENIVRKKLIANIAINSDDFIQKQQKIAKDMSNQHFSIAFPVSLNACISIFFFGLGMDTSLVFMYMASGCLTFLAPLAFTSCNTYSIKKITNEMIYKNILPIKLKDVYEKNMVEIIKKPSRNDELGFHKVFAGDNEMINIVHRLIKDGTDSKYKNYKIKSNSSGSDGNKKEERIFYKDEILSDRMFIFRSPNANYIFSGLSDIEMINLLLDAYKLIPYDDDCPYFYKKNDYNSFLEKK